ncbi:rRNA pseudouridine synthase, partial [Xanthomonas sp. Kuri4-2]
TPRHGLARVLSKLGVCSRSEAARWIMAGRVSVDRRIVRDPEFPIHGERACIAVDGQPLAGRERVYVMLNKPRGLVTTVSDEQGRDTVYRCLDGAGLPWLAPVGRLDKASEGLLLFSNDPQWAAAITDPERGPDKTYHVQVDCLPTPVQLQALLEGVRDGADLLRAKVVAPLRA